MRYLLLVLMVLMGYSEKAQGGRKALVDAFNEDCIRLYSSYLCKATLLKLESCYIYGYSGDSATKVDCEWWDEAQKLLKEKESN